MILHSGFFDFPASVFTRGMFFPGSPFCRTYLPGLGCMLPGLYLSQKIRLHFEFLEFLFYPI